MESNDRLVDYLKRENRIRTGKVEEAFRAVDRKNFVPKKYLDRAYEDVPLPIGQDATISAPHMVAINTELLDVEDDNRVLEIGSGSGYQLAILAELTSEKVIGIERIEDLTEASRETLDSLENGEVIHGNGLEAVEEEFDRILFSCSIDSLEPAKQYLSRNGIIVAPVKDGDGQLLKKYISGENRTEDQGHVKFVPYRDRPV